MEDKDKIMVEGTLMTPGIYNNTMFTKEAIQNAAKDLDGMPVRFDDSIVGSCKHVDIGVTVICDIEIVDGIRVLKDIDFIPISIINTKC